MMRFLSSNDIPLTRVSSAHPARNAAKRSATSSASMTVGVDIDESARTTSLGRQGSREGDAVPIAARRRGAVGGRSSGALARVVETSTGMRARRLTSSDASPAVWCAPSYMFLEGGTRVETGKRR